MKDNLPEAIFSLGVIFISFYFENYWVLLSLIVPLFSWIKINEEALDKMRELDYKLMEAKIGWYKRRK